MTPKNVLPPLFQYDGCTPNKSKATLCVCVCCCVKIIFIERTTPQPRSFLDKEKMFYCKIYLDDFFYSTKFTFMYFLFKKIKKVKEHCTFEKN